MILYILGGYVVGMFVSSFLAGKYMTEDIDESLMIVLLWPLAVPAALLGCVYKLGVVSRKKDKNE